MRLTNVTIQFSYQLMKLTKKFSLQTCTYHFHLKLSVQMFKLSNY